LDWDRSGRYRRRGGLEVCRLSNAATGSATITDGTASSNRRQPVIG